MLNLNQLSARIANLANDPADAAAFEHWFRVQSRDFHLWGSPEVQRAIYAVEAALSEYRFADLDEVGLTRELKQAIGPFVDGPRVRIFHIPVRRHLPGVVSLSDDRPIERIDAKPAQPLWGPIRRTASATPPPPLLAVSVA